MRNDAFRAARWAMLLGLGLMVAVAMSNPDAARERILAAKGLEESTRIAKQAASPSRDGKNGGSVRLAQRAGKLAATLTANKQRRRPAVDRTLGRRPTLFIEATRDPSRHASPRVELGPIVDSKPLGADHPLPTLYSPEDQFDSETPGWRVKPRTNVLTQSKNRVGSSPFETRLVGLQRKINQLAQAQELQKLEEQLEKLESNTRNESAGSSTDDKPAPPGGDSAPPGGDSASPGGDSASPAGDSTANAGGKSPAAEETAVLNVQPAEDGSERFSLKIQDADITQVLEMLGQLAGMNILVGKDVTGKVSANLIDVSVEEALSGILRSLGYVFEREDKFIFIMTEAEAAARKKLTRKIITKVYRPHYISVKDLQSLITPILTPEISKIAVTEPSEVGIASNAEEAGGDSLTQRDALLIQDYPEVIQEVDALLLELDVPPMQVVIEAMILSVKLTDSMEFGVNFALLNGGKSNLVVSGNGETLNNSSGFPGVAETIVPPAAEFVAKTAGLKYGFIRGDMSLFIKALEGIADTNLIASPQLRVLNKQRAELIIGKQLSYRTTTINGTASTENVQFLDVGTKLVIRPFIAPDGLVRMEIHPELSSGEINADKLPETSTTEVTTNVMVRDGTTIVIGGLIEEQVTESMERIPLLGALPWVGPVFRNKTERTDRTELIVLITPRIVREPEDAEEGEAVRFEYERRADHFRNNLSQINRRNLARMHYERALNYFEDNELKRAERHVELSLKYYKNNLKALQLRDQIQQAIRNRYHHWLTSPFTSADSEANELPEEASEDDSMSGAKPPPAPTDAAE